MIAFQDPLSQLPPPASTFAPDYDALFYFTFWLCVFFFVLIAGILGYSVLKHRRKHEDQPAASSITHHTGLEVTWTVIPLILVMIIFAWGWKGSLNMTIAPADALRYKVIGKQWDWFITHPGDSIAVTNEVWVPVNTPVKFELESNDVLHSFYIPAFRTKRDVLPGRYQSVWAQPTEIGDYNLFCAEYCGTNHSKMRGTVHVVSQEDFDKKPWDTWGDVWPDQPIAAGERVYQLCKSCHSTQAGVTIVGPSFRGLWGKEETVRLPDGRVEQVPVNEEYVTESIRNPSAKIVVGDPRWQPGAMTPFDETMLPDDRVLAIIEYLKSLQNEN